MSTWLTFGFCLVIFVMLVDFWRRGGTVPQGPAILTMLGIAGTFLGIALGLARFNTADITGSIPRLIDGMKIAVWASFAGVLAAIVLKYRDSLLANRGVEADAAWEGTATEESLGLRELIGVDKQTSLLQELKLLRRDLGERISRLEKSLDFLPERVARQTAKSLVDALTDTGPAAVPRAADNGTARDDDAARKAHVESS